VAKQNVPISYTFALSPFYFSLSSFPSLEHDYHHHMSTNITMDFIFAPSLGVY
jgi:hypothetical protein